MGCLIHMAPGIQCHSNSDLLIIVCYRILIKTIMVKLSWRKLRRWLERLVLVLGLAFSASCFSISLVASLRSENLIKMTNLIN